MRTVLVAILLALVAVVAWSQWPAEVPQPLLPVATTAPPASGPQDGIERITVAQLAARMSRPVGPSVDVLYGPSCPISQRMFPQLAALALQYGPQGVDFQAYSTDAAAGEIPGFLAQNKAPFRAVHVLRWRPGELDGALTPLGIQVGATWTRPLIVIRDATGRIVAQGQGVEDLGPLERALSSGALQALAK